MWIFLLSIFALAKGMAREVDCDDGIFDVCPRPKLFRRIPVDVDVFRTACPEALRYMKCIEEYDNKCTTDEEERLVEPKILTNIISVFDEICEEGSALNEVATSNLRCFNQTFSKTNCREEISKAFIEPFEKEVPLVELNTTTVEIPEFVYCLSEILFLGCIVEDISRDCGIRAGHATVEFLQRTSFVDKSCPLTYRKTLLEDLDDFQLTEVQKTFAISELERMKLADEA